MLCFICKKEFNLVNSLIFHLKRSHDVTTNSLVRCIESQCGQSFQNLNSFKRHINRSHINVVAQRNNVDKFETSEQIVLELPSLVRIYNPTINDLNTSSEFQQLCENVSLNSENNIQEENEENCKNQFVKKNEALTSKLLEFILSLHHNNNFTRKDVSQIQEQVKDCIIDPLLDMFMSFGALKFKNEVTVFNEFVSVIVNCKDMFKIFNTDHLLMKNLKSQGYVDKLQEFIVNNELRPKHCGGSLTISENKIRGVLLPLKFQFQKFFTENNLLKPTLEKINSMTNSKNKTINFVQGQLWQKKCSMYPNRILIPYILYTDDFEINNPLGSKSSKHSVCNIYYSFPCLPVEESKLENVFYAAVVKSNDLKTYGNEKCFMALIKELKDLEINGIEIDKKQIHFILGLVTGDNLGLNSFLGFSKSFSSNSYCRLCKVSKTDAQSLNEERTELLRTKENYAVDLLNFENSGILEESLLNSIPSFHVVENYYADIMHDIFEGIAHYCFSQAILYFIEIKYFDLETLNSRKKNFDYGPEEIDNVSEKIERWHITRKKFKMSARQMMTFIEYFPLMIGDLIPFDDPVWLYLLNLIDIIDTLLCFEVDEVSINKLKQKIKKLNSEYILLFKDVLKPKFHNLVHYPTILRHSGPLRKLWCFKYESKHREFKIYAHCITSRKNICLTLAKKYELKFAYQLMNKHSNLFNECTFNDSYKIDSNYKNVIADKLNIPETFLQFYLRIRFKGVLYKQGHFVAILENDIHVYVIVEIVRIQAQTVVLFGQKLLNINYNKHFVSYEFDANDLGPFEVIFIHDIIGPPITIINTARNRKMIRLKKHYKIIS